MLNKLTTNPKVAKTVFISSGNAKLFCTEIGRGKPVIVIHGGPGLSRDYLLPQMYDLGKNHFVIFYDQRGCGKSTGDINTDTVTIDSFVNDIEAIRKAFHLNQVSVLGHSWGGFLAMQYCIRNQKHVDKLILSNSCPATSEGYTLFCQEYMRRLDPYQKKLENIRHTQDFLNGIPEVMEQFYRLIFRQYCYIPEKADLINLYMTSTASLNGAKVAEIIRKNVWNQPFNLNKDLNLLKIPTLILHGDVDPVPSMTAKNIHENIPGSQYILMKDCGHFPYVENPRSYFKHINEFLNH